MPANAPLAEGNYLTVPLRKMRARHFVDTVADQEKLYVAEVSVGHPGQAMSVLIDTSSGNVILPHRACPSTACSEHRRYSPWESSSAIDVNFKGEAIESENRLVRGKHRREGMTLTYTQSDLGEGNATTVVVRDQLCLEKGEKCVDMGFLAAVQLDDKPFRALPSDGILGLGLDGLVASPICSFFSRLLEGSHSSLAPLFGLALGPAGGELHLGGTDASKYQGSLTWFPVDHADQGFWQIPVQAVYLGEEVVDSCEKGCHAIIDTGVARLGVQEGRVPNLRNSLRSSCHTRGALKFRLASSADASDFTFFEVSADVYGDEACEPLLGNLPLEEPDFVGVYTFGTSVLQRYYTAFDWGARRWGFAPLQQQQQIVV